MRSRILSLCFFSILLFGQNAFAQNSITVGETTLVEREISIGLNVPWELKWGPDDHLWVTEKIGRINRINPFDGTKTEILDLRDEVEHGWEAGMLGMCFDNDFQNNSLIYVAYTYELGFSQLRERLVSFEWDGQNLINETTLLEGLPAATFHNGSRLLFTDDNKILMTIGDARSPDLAQDKSRFEGKLLRINPDGSIPSDNPDPESYVYSFGHRNAQGLAYGPNRQIYSSEHGNMRFDEFNLIASDRNYGWPNVEGLCNTNAEQNFCSQFDVVEPLWQWDSCFAVNDICYYEHDAIPAWKGKMLMAVLGGFEGEPSISALEFNDDGTEIVDVEEYLQNHGRLRDICINPNTGSIYFATNGFEYPSSGPNRIIEYYVPGLSTNEDIYQEQVKVGPNPVKKGQDFIISIPSELIEKQFNIITLEGKIIQQGKLSNLDNIINTVDLPSGHYIFSIQKVDGVINKSLIIID